MGWHYISRRRPMLLLVGVTNFALAGVNLYKTLLARFNLDADFAQRGLSFESGYAIMTTVTGVGTLLGGLIISSWGGLKRQRVSAC